VLNKYAGSKPTYTQISGIQLSKKKKKIFFKEMAAMKDKQDDEQK
jgi:hypothetical protein